MTRSIKIDAQIPAKLRFLFEPATEERGRYKIIYGGRGGVKSWTVARVLLIRGVKKARRNKLGPGETESTPTQFRVLCARETQKSIKESVHHLLSLQIDKLGLREFYQVDETRIYGKPGTSAEGTEFIFEGLRYNIDEVKSLEAIDILWIEEANKVRKIAWETIIPTIRTEYDDGGVSEIIATFNPDMETDEAYRRFVVLKNRPANAIVVETSYRDNPWFPRVLEAERLELKRTDPDAYLTVWEGKPRQVLEGAVFAKELRAAKEAGRICRFEIERGHPVFTHWDLGRRDMTSIWFIQRVALQWRVIDFYENNLEHIDHYIGVLQTKGYVYRTHFLPHDAKAKVLGSKRTIEEQLRGAEEDSIEVQRDVRIIPALSIADQHNAVRSIFNNCWFHEDNCSDGLKRLGRYCYKVDPDTKQFSLQPLHDENSHAASAFMNFAVSARVPERKKRDQIKMAAGAVNPALANHPQGWMG